MKEFVYVLELQGGNYYVGLTRNLPCRIYEHFSGDKNTGALWTKKHPPLRVLSVQEAFPGMGKHLENAIFAAHYAKHGDSVRGGAWCQVEMTKPPGFVLEAQSRKQKYSVTVIEAQDHEASSSKA